MSPLLHFWKWYQNSLRLRPIVTKTSSAGLIFFSSDLVTQAISRDDDDSNSSMDIHRALSGAGFGVLGTVYLHYWWGFLEGALEARLPVGRRKFANTFVKVLIDQGVSAPFYCHNYYFFTNFVKPKAKGKRDPQDLTLAERAKLASARAREMVLPTMIVGWKIWPAIIGFNFYFVPMQNRVLVQNLALCVWSGYLSHLNHGQDSIKETEIVEKPIGAVKLKRRKTVFTGLDVVEEEVTD
mmetsp:Transcript_61485/g.181709  ORF Transcript_61485/g.181709 Transcript_61485/m.181709 type:complete len:239 (-) Transcript_61485:133-849(-)